MYNDKHIKAKIRIYNSKINTNFHDKIPEDNEYCACLSVMLLDSVFVDAYKDYYPQIFLEFKYSIKKKKIINTINEQLKLDESDDEYDDSYERTNEY